MVNIIKEEITLEESLKKKLEFICDFAKVKPIIINGSIRKIDKTNLTYIEPHRIIINNITFLIFNYSNDVYIKNFGNKIKINELEDYLKKIEFICDFTNNKPTIINGSIRKIDKTNLTYIEPHRIIINNTTFFAFNYSNEIFIENLSNEIKLSELEDYLKTI